MNSLISKSEKNNPDWKKIYDTQSKKNLWLIGYFGGGSINFSRYEKIAKEFSEEIGCPIETVEIDEIFNSNWCKGFKYLFSTYASQNKIEGYKELEDVGKYFNS